MTQPSSHEWIDHFLETDPPRSKSLVMTIFGDAIAPHGGRLWLDANPDHGVTAGFALPRAARTQPPAAAAEAVHG